MLPGIDAQALIHPSPGGTFDPMRRRDFIVSLGAAALAWPQPSRAQQPALPVVGFMSARSANDPEGLAAAFRRGLNESGFVAGQNVTIEYRWAEFRYERLPVLASDLVRRKVAVIAAISGTPTALAAKAATATIPIVFAIGGDPVTTGLVTSLNRPGGNVTGASFFTTALGAKRLEMLRELAPKATTIAVFVNPNNPPSVSERTAVQAAATALGVQVRVFDASTEGHIDSAFTTIVQQRIGALLVTGDPFFSGQRKKLVALAARHALPAMYFVREFALAGGLISYGTKEADTYRQAGVYVGRILKGEKAGDLPVMLPTKFELVVNLKTAKALGLEVPPKLLAIADEVIE
jgi:putative ABC transport system substrate-binding protein